MFQMSGLLVYHNLCMLQLSGPLIRDSDPLVCRIRCTLQLSDPLLRRSDLFV